MVGDGWAAIRRQGLVCVAATVAVIAGAVGPARGQDEEACRVVEEFGLENVPNAAELDVVKRCRRGQSRPRSRSISGQKSALQPSAVDLEAARKERIEETYNRGRRKPRAIYGRDDRYEAEEAARLLFPQPGQAEALRKAIRATAILTNRNRLDRATAEAGAGNGPARSLKLDDYKIDTYGFGPLPLCKGQKFADQQTGGDCTAFLVAPDVVATAGHCVGWVDVDEADSSRNKYSVVFGFEMRNGAPRAVIPEDEIFEVARIRELSDPDQGQPDFALLQLDRPVPPEIAEPLLLPGEAGRIVGIGDRLALIGHPSGLPKKVSLLEKSRIMEVTGDGAFKAQLNAFHGNSGSPVVLFDRPDVVAGILVKGQSDFETDPGSRDQPACVRYQVYRDTGDQMCGRERCAETSTNATLLEPYLR
ncbi:MAG: trypsin-like peptidase domain-containing protein [Hyphomicrobiaceae bacterium]|nr:trypsin-like peptidase domain-containing protein [Hyphomicrobiaceae bacterium]